MCWQLLKRQQLHPLTVVALVATELVVGLDEEPEGAAPPLLRRSSRPMLLLGAGLLSWGRAWAAVDCGAAGLLVRDRCVEGDDVAARLLKNCMQGDRLAPTQPPKDVYCCSAAVQARQTKWLRCQLRAAKATKQHSLTRKMTKAGKVTALKKRFAPCPVQACSVSVCCVYAVLQS